jgi:hypothetical protein
MEIDMTDPVREALAELEAAEAHYRLIFQTAPTAGHLDVGRAWDRMRKAGDAAREALAQPAVQGEPVALREVGLTRDIRGMCIVTINGREAIRDNGDVISHYATLDWFAQPPAPLTLTQDQIMEYVREAGLDWHRGWIMGEPPVNRYEEFARAVLAASQEKEKP